MFQIDNSGDRSVLRKAVSGAHQREVLDVLGILPSSLLQTNCAIWVEGPTERLLVRRWLAIMAPDIQEHVHYSFMITAGSLLEYFSTDVASTRPGSKFIDILRVCRNSFLICDKDSDTEEPSKEFVRRIQEKLRHLGGSAEMWITDGYEIEWYYPAEAIRKLWKRIDPIRLLTKENEGSPFFKKLNEIGDPDAQVKSAGERKAEWAATLSEDDSLTSQEWFGPSCSNRLAQRVRSLASFLRRVNHLADSFSVPTCTTCQQPLISRNISNS